MEVLDCIRNRRSVRSFTDKKVEYDTIKELLEITYVWLKKMLVIKNYGMF